MTEPSNWLAVITSGVIWTTAGVSAAVSITLTIIVNWYLNRRRRKRNLAEQVYHLESWNEQTDWTPSRDTNKEQIDGIITSMNRKMILKIQDELEISIPNLLEVKSIQIKLIGKYYYVFFIHKLSNSTDKSHVIDLNAPCFRFSSSSGAPSYIEIPVRHPNANTFKSSNWEEMQEIFSNYVNENWDRPKSLELEFRDDMKFEPVQIEPIIDTETWQLILE